MAVATQTFLKYEIGPYIIKQNTRNRDRAVVANATEKYFKICIFFIFTVVVLSSDAPERIGAAFFISNTMPFVAVI